MPQSQNAQQCPQNARNYPKIPPNVQKYLKSTWNAPKYMLQDRRSVGGRANFPTKPKGLVVSVKKCWRRKKLKAFRDTISTTSSQRERSLITTSHNVTIV